MTSLWRVAPVLVSLVVAAVGGGCAAAAPEVAAGPVVVLTAHGPVTPVMAGYVNRGLTLAEQRHAAAVVLQVDTPGGLDTAMREIVQRINGSNVAVLAYVAPSGGRAASAGTFIVMAGHVAAMAPSTAIGAAHPVNSNGSDIEGTMAEKVTNDAVAYLRGIAQQRGRNADWAERAVRQSISAPAADAARDHVVDFVASDLSDLLAHSDGRTVTLPGGPAVLRLKDAIVQLEPMNLSESALSAFADPNVAFLLMAIAVMGIFLELSHPGAILPGIVGGVSLLLALFSAGTLPITMTGLLFIGFGGVLLLAEVWVVSHGMLGLGGVACIVVGGLLLTGGSPPAGLEVNRWLIAAVALALGGPVFVAARSMAHLRGLKVVAGTAALVGERAVAYTALAPSGTVRVHGELWRAMAEGGGEVAEGGEVVVMGTDGFTLRVRPVEYVEPVE